MKMIKIFIKIKAIKTAETSGILQKLYVILLIIWPH